MPDHVHMVIKLSTTVTIAEIAKKAKGVSSRFINQKIQMEDHFKWQIGYGAFTVSRWDTDKVIQYVRNQKSHHECGDLIRRLETSFDQETKRP